ncbi:hypothetical protein GCM10011514_22390 [Emticicia aquatilis]|uniref:Uncharacterized protein n=1 Tax=Emticicia aquatilis TaxID=1537369 RepID=A0A916YSI3_9BACT|nr:hypothetical protein [Emticicia aquatilis]GGD57813.1 hypothetical protein GCM10011514_22390 [Emticicia aquatilis]
MTATIIILALLAGWCGTPYPRRWRFLYPPIPKPDPEVCSVCGKVMGALGGLSLNLGLYYVGGLDLSIETTLIAGYIGGILVNDIAASMAIALKK